MARKLLLTLLALLVSTAALWWLLSAPVLAALGEALQRADPWRLALAWLLVPVIQGLRAARFALLAGRPRGAFWILYAINARLLLLSYLVPFGLGVVSFPLMMQRAFGTGYLPAAGVLIMARLMDLCVVCAMFALGAALLLDPAARPWSLTLLLLMLGAALVLPVAGVELLEPLVRLLRPGTWYERLVRQVVMVQPRSARAQTLALTLAIWLTHAVLAYHAARAVAQGFSFWQIMLASAAANLAFAVPVSGLAGLGPPQAAWATLLHLTGVPWPPAIVTALFLYGILLSGALVVGTASFLLPDRPRASELRD